MEKLKHIYTSISILFLNTVLLFIIVNLLMAGVFWIKDPVYRSRQRPNPLQVYEPFVEMGLRPINGESIHVSEGNFRIIKDQGPWPPDPDAYTIFVFGSSTTYGLKVTDDETIPSYLQEHLQHTSCTEPVYVYNLARSGYFSTMERIYFEQLLLSGHIPDMAIFIDGLTDPSYEEPVWTPRLRDFVNGEYERQMQSLANRTIDLARDLPIGRTAQWANRVLIRSGIDPTALDPTEPEAPPPDDEERLNHFLERWMANKTMIEAIAATYDVQPVFVWQPVPTYNYDLTYHEACQKKDCYFEEAQPSEYLYAMMDEARPGIEPDDNFFWLADMQADKHENLYVDLVHYTPEFSDEIAEVIAAMLQERNLLGCQSD